MSSHAEVPWVYHIKCFTWLALLNHCQRREGGPHDKAHRAMDERHLVSSIGMTRAVSVGRWIYPSDVSLLGYLHVHEWLSLLHLAGCHSWRSQTWSFHSQAYGGSRYVILVVRGEVVPMTHEPRIAIHALAS